MDLNGNLHEVADGKCDVENNIEGCNWDGGDCCPSTCEDAVYECSDANEFCIDPNAGDNPCRNIECEDPPEPSCDGNAVVYFSEDGSCNNGSCYYEPSYLSDCGQDICTYGICLNADNPCAGVACDGPPSGVCEAGKAISYAVPGVCAPEFCEQEQGLDDGVTGVCGELNKCVYFPVEETCGEGEYCENGICMANLCEPGYVEDCSGDGDCCLEDWIGDGYGDCETQFEGCDLSCYSNDAGDCP
tara:strand:+ start:36 stop:767 length:732 start_codon:yes stop_codon:yes gene_type:complete